MSVIAPTRAGLVLPTCQQQPSLSCSYESQESAATVTLSHLLLLGFHRRLGCCLRLLLLLLSLQLLQLYASLPCGILQLLSSPALSLRPPLSNLTPAAGVGRPQVLAGGHARQICALLKASCAPSDLCRWPCYMMFQQRTCISWPCLVHSKKHSSTTQHSLAQEGQLAVTSLPARPITEQGLLQRPARCSG